MILDYSFFYSNSLYYGGGEDLPISWAPDGFPFGVLVMEDQKSEMWMVSWFLL